VEIKGVIDRLEGDYAVVLLGELEQKVNWPINLLPGLMKEGDILSFQLTINTGAAKKQAEEIKNLWDSIVKN